MKAKDLKIGEFIESDGIRKERVSNNAYRMQWGKRVPKGYIALCAPVVNNQWKLDWWLLKEDAEVYFIGNVNDIARNN